MKRVAFTLIELLVVVTIIVVLLALLAPALDKAIHRAQLAVCAGQLDHIATGVNLYAVENSRFYPYRAAMYQGGVNVALQPLHVTQRAGQDDRARIASHVNLDALIDPLSETISINPQDHEPYDAEVIFHSSYELFFSFQYASDKGMRKLGDSWTYTHPSATGPVTETFNVIAADTDMVFNQARVIGSHPDRDGRLSPLVITEPDPLIVSGTTGLKEVFTRYEGGAGRGLTDLNFAYADGGVAQRNDVQMQDDRMATVPYISFGGGYPAEYINIAR